MMDALPTVRVLPPEEWEKLAHIEPFDRTGLPSPGHWRIVVAEVEGVIVGFSCLFDCVHMEPLWIDPAYRARPHAFGDVLTGLWAGCRVLLHAADVQMVFAVVGDALPRNADFVKHLGFIPAEGTLYIVPTDGVRLGG
jgi:hypothetical protein